MPEEATVVVKANDKFSDAVKKMSAVTKAFTKDVGAREDTLDGLSRNKVELRVDLSKATASLKQAKKEFDGTAASIKKISDAQLEVDHITRNLNTVGRAAKEAEKHISTLENRANGGTSGFSKKLDGVINAIAISGIGDMAKDLMINAGTRFWGSSGGDDAGTMASTILSSAMSDAALGWVLPGVGNVVGAIAGGALGAISGWANGSMQVFEKRTTSSRTTTASCTRSGSPPGRRA